MDGLQGNKGVDKAGGCTQQQEGPCGLLGRSQAIQMRASKLLGQIHCNASGTHTRPRPYRADVLRALSLAHDSSHAQWPVRRATILDASPLKRQYPAATRQRIWKLRLGRFLFGTRGWGLRGQGCQPHGYLRGAAVAVKPPTGVDAVPKTSKTSCLDTQDRR